jgi:hypothetical protein
MDGEFMRVFRYSCAAVGAAFVFACSPPSQKTTPASETALNASASTLVAAATKSATETCKATTAPTAIGEADFDGDGVSELLVDWSGTACAQSEESVCSPTLGCLRQVWRQTGGAPSPVFRGQAKAIRLDAKTPSPTLIVDQAGSVCGRPDGEICRTLYRWDARSSSLQEFSREIVAART